MYAPHVVPVITLRMVVYLLKERLNSVMCVRIAARGLNKIFSSWDKVETTKIKLRLTI